MKASLLGGHLRMRRFGWSALLFVSASLLSLVLVLSFFQQTSYADPTVNDTASWVNQTTIRLGDSNFTRTVNGTESRWIFAYSSDSGGVTCRSTLTFEVDPYGPGGGQSAYRKLSLNQGGICNMPDGPNGKLITVADSSIVNGNTDDQTGSDGGAAGAEDEEPDTSCEARLLNPLSWFICPLANGMLTFTEHLDFWIADLMTVDTAAVFNPNGNEASEKTSNAYYAAWNSFRLIALGIVVIAALVVIIASAFGLELLDAYTIRKALPRVALAVILIALSWDILEFLVTLSNDVGNGVRALIYSPFSGFEQFQVRFGEQSAFATGLLVAFFAMGPLAILSFALTAMLAVLVAFLVLVLREMIIILLVILAPVAFTFLILPNTQKYWQFWQNTLTAMLIAFPIIAAFIATGRVFSAVAYQDGEAGTLNGIIAFVAYFLPYFLLPLTFRLAGGMLGALGNFANNMERGPFDRLKKARQQAISNRWGQGGKYREPLERRTLQKRADWAAGLQNRASRSGFVGGLAARGLARGVGGYNIEAKMSGKRAQVAKELNDQIATGEDDEIRGMTATYAYDHAKKVGWEKALADSKAAEARGDFANVLVSEGSNGERQYRSLGGRMVNEAHVMAGKRRWGNDTFAQQAALSYEMRKASTEDELQGITKNYDAWASSMGLSDKEKTGNWIGAAFERQNENLQFKNMRLGDVRTDQNTGQRYRAMEMNADGYKKFATEVHEKKGTYQLGQMSAETIRELQNAYDYGDAETKQKVQSVALNCVSQ